MLSSATASGVQNLYDEDGTVPRRRIRHITGIQIRNLTPFPVRDAVTTALTQPTEQPHFNVSGTIDDLGAIISRRHTRKTSTNSTATRLSLKWDDGIPEDKNPKPSSVSRGRRASISSTISSSSFIVSVGSSRSARSLRGHRPRTSSLASSSSNILFDTTGESSSLASSLIQDNSQTGLEKIINSRIVETFIVISIPEDVNQDVEACNPDLSANSPTALCSAPVYKSSVISCPRHQKASTVVSPSRKESSLATSPHKNRVRIPGSAPPSKTTFKTPTTPKHDVRSKGLPEPAGKMNGASFPPSMSTSRSSKSSHLLETDENLSSKSNISETPIYFSSIHRPSTNPFFPIDARSGQDFPQQSKTSGEFLKIQIWAKIPALLGEESVLHRRFHHSSKPSVTEEYHEWKLLEERDIDLNKILPLPPNLDTNPSQLPSNTVIITLSPPGHAFYVPNFSSPPLRPSSPHDGYTSDPESEVRKIRQLADPPHSAVDTTSSTEIVPLSRRRRQRGGNSIDFRDQTKTASWQELFKLVNLQSLISDNESSLREVIRKIDNLLEEDTAFPLRREVSERQARIGDLHANHKEVLDQIAQKRLEIADRSRRLQKRNEMLASARDALQLNAEIDARIEDERDRLTSIRETTHSTRTSLLSELSTIFPIELYSPPDLLYTILDVPLPIPLNSNDPAPPLSMPEHKDVTEDSVATALGYVAQVLQTLAAYMGKSLIYPVTCIGSRSLIRDGISAMVGPRMFPLFSKGVDTYRFEYGVFLLNKDIEMLMSERDLRALDMRHTLPNLKNLLLTLSHDNAPQHQPILTGPPIPASLDSSVETPSRESSPVIDDVHTPKPSHIVLETHGLGEGTTPTASGTTTPTASTTSDDSRKQKSFLGFVPFTDFLRGRYPSSASHSSEKTPTKSTRSSELEEGLEDEQSGDEDSEYESDEEDRTTIHGAASDGVPDALTRDGGIVAET